VVLILQEAVLILQEAVLILQEAVLIFQESVLHVKVADRLLSKEGLHLSKSSLIPLESVLLRHSPSRFPSPPQVREAQLVHLPLKLPPHPEEAILAIHGRIRAGADLPRARRILGRSPKPGVRSPVSTSAQ